MSSSDSMFLLEIVVEELKSFIDCKDFYIQCQFADVFILNLRDPNYSDTLLPKVIKPKKKNKIRKKITEKPTDKKVLSCQSVLITSKINTLVIKMKNFPIELSLYNRDNMESKVGSTHIPWSPVFIDYVNKLLIEADPSPVYVSGGYNVYDDFTSKRMATIRLNIKLSYLTIPPCPHPLPPRLLFEKNQNTFMPSEYNLKSRPILNTLNNSISVAQETGTIKTIYSSRKPRKIKTSKPKIIKKNFKENAFNPLEKQENDEETFEEKQPVKAVEETNKIEVARTFKSSHINLVKSDTELDKNKQIDIIKTKSCSSIKREQFNILNYIFGDINAPHNKVYCVSYFTVENEFNKSGSSSAGSPQSSVKPVQSSDKVNSSDEQTPVEKYKFRICDKECPSRRNDNSSQNMCSVDLPAEAAHLITVTKCKHLECENRKMKEPAPPPDERILLQLTDKECCKDFGKTNAAINEIYEGIKAKTETVVGGLKAKMKFGKDECFCSCECTFGYVRKTTYCGVCGGYEYVGEDNMASSKVPNAPFPCPIYHKLADKNKLKSTLSTSGSEGKKSLKRSVASTKSARNTESEKEHSEKSKKNNDRFKFNYGYTAPKIGHIHCATPCTGSLGTVPKNMGWLWTAENIPGLKFRPLWKPGATNKHVVRLLRMAKNPDEVFTSKRKKKVDVKVKKPVVRPLLIVKKKDGEYTVTMETMKTYSKPRALNQQPYEDKPPLTYTIGRTEEENRERQKKKDRAKRRLEREQRKFIQNTFRDMCQEICLKTYQQALGILPDTEDPDCACYPMHPGADQTNLDRSCSCSEDNQSFGSDTDSDEWVVEFTPPNATFDPQHKGKKVVKVDNESQYTYLDYKVKLLDRYGNPVPRFFKGPDGKNECSDLGGFWSPGHKWLEINVDGFIAPDGKWAPMNFTGPNGDQVDCEMGKFQSGGKTFIVGIDGYVDCNGRWRNYPGAKGRVTTKKPIIRRKDTRADGEGGRKYDKNKDGNKSESTWSCFGDAKPEELTHMGILGHGHDKKLLIAAFKDMKIELPSMEVPRFRGKRRISPNAYDSKTYFLDRQKCKHPEPSDKGVVARDQDGNKTYFRLKEPENRRSKSRYKHLQSQGISLSSFHVPCMRSFINQEVMKKEQYERIMALSRKNKTGVDKCVGPTQEIARGWKPGAISKRLLKMLNKARRDSQSNQQTTKPARKTKKRVEDKPTLVICKRNGEYVIEMQVDSEDQNVDCSPLIYKIASADNEARIKSRARKERRLIRKAVKEVWSDPYHPEACERTCLKAYKQAIGCLPYELNNPECICPEEEVETSTDSCSCEDNEMSSECSSLDVDWEIHFSPPIAGKKLV